MSLPSRYAPGGIHSGQENMPITVGKYQKKPIDFTIKTIEDKVERAVSQSSHDEDIEMVPMDNFNEVTVISDYVTNSRTSEIIDYEPMMVDGDQGPDMLIEPNVSYLILDTNFVLSHLKLLNDIKRTALKYLLRIIIPLAVMQELDGLKSSSKRVDEAHDSTVSNKTIGHLARWANDWIFNELSNVNSIVKGQKHKQRLDRTATKDNSILDCCLYFKENYTQNLVVLLSNDKNLCLKALANEVLTVSFKEGMTSDLISQTISNESIRLYGGSNSIKINTPTQSRSTQSRTQTIEEKAQTIYNEVTTLTKSAIHHVMVHIYDDDLELIQNYVPEEIIDLEDCSRTINQFWLSAFSEYLQRINFKEGFITDVPSTLPTLKAFVNEWSKLLEIIYDKLLDERQNEALSRLIQRWESMVN